MLMDANCFENQLGNGEDKHQKLCLFEPCLNIKTTPKCNENKTDNET